MKQNGGVTMGKTTAQTYFGFDGRTLGAWGKPRKSLSRGSTKR